MTFHSIKFKVFTQNYNSKCFQFEFYQVFLISPKICLINGIYYRYDFAIFNKEDNLIRLIEFDGIQHYDNKQKHWGHDITKTQERDKIKNQYALQNNIPLVRIPYIERDNITLEMLLGNEYLVER